MERRGEERLKLSFWPAATCKTAKVSLIAGGLLADRLTKNGMAIRGKTNKQSNPQ